MSNLGASLGQQISELVCWNRKYLIFNLTVRNLKLRYRNSWLGGFWTVLLPAASALIYYFVFGFVIRVKTEHYLAFVLSGTLAWTFFSTAINGSMETIVQNVRLLNKVPLPPQALVYAEILTNLLNFVFALPTLILVVVFSGITPHWQLIYLPLLLLMLVLQATGLGLMLGIGNAYFRDLKHLMIIVIQIWFYLTPILYSLDRWPEDYRWTLYLNPLSYLFSGLQAGTLGQGELDAKMLVSIVVWTGFIMISALFFLRRTRYRLVEAL